MTRSAEFPTCLKAQYGERWKEGLREEYEALGTEGVARKWGFHITTVRAWLKKLGILNPSPWYRWRRQVARRVAAAGGIEAVLAKNMPLAKTARAIRAGKTLTARLIKEAGYEWDKERRVWRRSNDVR